MVSLNPASTSACVISIASLPRRLFSGRMWQLFGLIFNPMHHEHNCTKYDNPHPDFLLSAYSFINLSTASLSLFLPILHVIMALLFRVVLLILVHFNLSNYSVSLCNCPNIYKYLRITWAFELNPVQIL